MIRGHRCCQYSVFCLMYATTMILNDDPNAGLSSDCSTLQFGIRAVQDHQRSHRSRFAWIRSVPEPPPPPPAPSPPPCTPPFLSRLWFQFELLELLKSDRALDQFPAQCSQI
eukprot:scpid53604/ scgid23806/ 